MKKTKILVPAAGLLLLGTAASVTSTVAWFAMNSTVSATGMQIKAKADGDFLQIQARATSWDASAAQTTIAINNSPVAEIMPTHVSKAVAGDALTAYDGGTTYVFVSTYSDDPAASAMGAGNTYADVTSSVASYALKTELKVRLKPGTGTGSVSNLKVTAVDVEAKTQSPDDITDGLIDSIRVFAVTSSAGVVWKDNERVEGATGSIIAAAVTSAADVNIDVYVYFDGEDPDCYTNNALTPDDYIVSVSFGF